jgi:hypothetical protein
MRVRSSFWKPFITDSTTISAATPSAMPQHRDQRDEGDEAVGDAFARLGAGVAQTDEEFVVHASGQVGVAC